MNWKLFVGLRYLTRRRKERFVSIISVISILGVIVGVAALIIVLSIMTGFDLEIKKRIIGTYSHIVITKEGGIINEGSISDALKKNKNIVAASPFIDEPAFIKKGNSIQGIILRGLDAKREEYVSNVKAYIDSGKLDFGKNGIILGKELKKTLGLKKGDMITVFSPYSNKKFPFINKSKDFTVMGTFTSGRYDYDANLAFTDIESAKELFTRDTVSGIGVKVKDEFNVGKVKRELKGDFRYPYTVRSWMDLDKNLMNALAMEKKIMFIILALIILVACFNIASSLIMQVLEKTKDIGIMRAIGATSSDVKKIFIMLGSFIGLSGALIGSVLGVLIAKNINVISGYVERLTGFELFPSDIYYLSEIPVKIMPGDVILTALVSLILAVLASFYPAWRASRLDPVYAIRYE